MKVLFDIGHPAHVHFFREPIRLLLDDGDEVRICVRDKECALDLLRALDLPHRLLSRPMGRGALGLLRELIAHDVALYRYARRERPDVMAGIGGIFIAQVGVPTRIPSLVFYDTENATLQNALTYPFATRVIVPSCYQGRLPKSHLRYPGYHELSYLHPNRFRPEREIALKCGLDAERETFLVRTVAWTASHDIGEPHWSGEVLKRLVAWLSERGRVVISAEAALPEELEHLRYRGRAEDLHHLMAFCRLYVGESATMASEAAVLGIPAIYAAATGRGYTDHQESAYGLVRNLRKLDAERIERVAEEFLARDAVSWKQARTRLLDDNIDVAAFVVEQLRAAAPNP